MVILLVIMMLSGGATSIPQLSAVKSQFAVAIFIAASEGERLRSYAAFPCLFIRSSNV